MALIAPFARVTRSTNRSTPYRGDHRMPATERYRRPDQRVPRPAAKAAEESQALLTAEPLDFDYKHEIIRRIHQEGDQAPPSGPKCSERSGIETSSGSSRRRWYCTGSTITTASMNAARDTRAAGGRSANSC